MSLCVYLATTNSIALSTGTYMSSRRDRLPMEAGIGPFSCEPSKALCPNSWRSGRRQNQGTGSLSNYWMLGEGVLIGDD